MSARDRQFLADQTREGRAVSARTWKRIRIADSSIEYDRDIKSRIYAESRIPEYWLADLNANLVWRYWAPEEGTFRSIEQKRHGESIYPLLLPQCVIAVDVLLTE